jgi:hypothetical protein
LIYYQTRLLSRAIEQADLRQSFPASTSFRTNLKKEEDVSSYHEVHLWNCHSSSTAHRFLFSDTRLSGLWLVILAWKTAGYYGLDYFLLPRLGTPWGRAKLESSSPAQENVPGVA